MRKRTLTPGQSSQPQDKRDSRSFVKALEVDILARTMWGESRGEGAKGLQAVANVVLNRVQVASENGTYWWGTDVISVCQKPFQFSCWNPDDPNREKLLAVQESNLEFASCLRVARRAVYGQLSDLTGGATHYHADYVSPYWAENKMPTARIGRHIFYRLVE